LRWRRRAWIVRRWGCRWRWWRRRARGGEAKAVEVEV